MSETKICRICGVEKPLSEFWKSQVDKLSGIQKYYHECRVCMVAHRQENAERIAANSHRSYMNNRAKRLAARAQYRADKPDEVRERKRQDHAKHRAERNAKSRQWALENPERKRENAKRWREENRAYAAERRAKWYAENRDKVLLSAKAYRDLHLDEIHAYQAQYRLDNPEKVKALARKYWREHPDRAAAAHAKRKALKLNATGSHTAADIADIRRLQGDKCANPACRCKLKGRGHKDHRVALINGGDNDRRNMQILCGPCNCSKRARDEIEFFQAQVHEVSKPGASVKLLQPLLL